MRLSRDPAARRRLTALALACLAALAAGIAVGASIGGDRADDRQPAPRRPAPDARRAPGGGLTPGQLAGQLLLARYAGETPPAYILRALRARRLGGVVLFRDNASSPSQLRAATRALQRAAHGAALVATDQEGPIAKTLAWAPPDIGQPEQRTTGVARREAAAAARALSEAGVNFTLGPVADVARPGSVVGARAFPGDGDAVGPLVRAAVEGYRGGSVAAAVKHFPGLGGAGANTDDRSVSIGLDRAELEQTDLEPFRAAIAGDAPAVMAGHALYPALDDERIASQSPAVLDTLLRTRLGFRGVVVTDSMEAAAVTARSTVEEAAIRSVGAGADLVLLTGQASYTPVRRRLAAEIRRSPRFAARAEQAAGRVRALKRALALEGG